MNKNNTSCETNNHCRKMYLNTPIPSRLETPPSSLVNPPVKTRKQELPFRELSWEDFEKLCLRLVRLETDVEHCQLYGVPGQKQEGIDIYARKKLAEKYQIYQCKRVTNFGPSKIRKAISEFLEGEWINKADSFVLCSMESLRSTGTANELEIQSALLKEKDIKLIPWDSCELSAKLKGQPALVDDFFGREWVRAFCGEEQAERLGKRLDVGKVIEFRKELARFYKNVFKTHDPGLLLPMPDETEVLPLEDRYVLPDIYDQRAIPITHAPRDNQSGASENEPIERLIGNSVFEYRQQPGRSQHLSTLYRQREPIERWIATADRLIILGGPGSGKSTLLRFIAIDLLQESPRLTLLSQKWGQFLPIWVPFALWTKSISERDSAPCSLGELLHDWLKSWDEERLWPLVEQALEDERLLLLVDGLDEYTGEQSAGIAIDQLKVFIDQRNIPAIITSRPRGFERLKMQKTGWQIGELSDFSIIQQKELSRIWFSHRIRNLYHDNAQEEREINLRIDAENEDFINELQESADFRELAKVPLFLCLLIFNRFRNVHLPRSRFEAYDSLIEYLISIHPKQRRKAASFTIASSEFNDEETKQILARLAYHIQENFAEGVINSKEALTILEDYLKDCECGFGFRQREAHQHSREILETGENTIGLLVTWPPDEIGFFHRLLQEYLAAHHLSLMPLSEQLSIVKLYCADPQWYEVILGLFHITGRMDDIKQLVDHIKAKADEVNIVERYTIDLLLCEIAFGDFNCPVSLARELAHEVFEQIELGSWMPYRERLLQHVLEGLRSTKVEELVKSKLEIWFPCRKRWRQGIFRAMGKWPQNPEVFECLWKGIHDEESVNQRAAAVALADLAAGDSEIGERITSLALKAVDPKIRAAAIEALLQGWSNHQDIESILEAARHSGSPELRLVAILGRIRMQIHTEEDWEELIHLGSRESELDFDWQKDVALALMTGWPKSPKTKETCLKISREDKPDWQKLERDLALGILLEGYPQDEEVAQFCVDEICHKEYPFILLHHDAWVFLSRNFKDHPQIVEAIDEWITKRDHFPNEIAMAALVGGTQKAKAKLLSLLDLPLPHWAAEALLEGWGMQDSEVAKELKKIAFGPAVKASQIAYLLPQIIEDKAVCRSRLLELLQDPGCIRPDFVMKGLRALGNTQGDTEVVGVVLDSVLSPPGRGGFLYEEVIIDLILGYSSDERVKNLAKRELSRRDGNYAAAAWAYGQDDEMRQRIIEIACPLPVHLRKIIAAHLGERGLDEEFALSLLELYDHEQDEEVKTQASISYHTRLKASKRDTNSAVESLSKSIVCYGIDHKERRQAAFCGLIILDRLDVMLNAKDRNCAISIDPVLRPNAPLLKHILLNWDGIKAVLGEEFWPRLFEFRSDELGRWDAFCIFADEYPSPRDEALHFLETREERTATSNILQFLGRASPKSRLLLEYCLKALRIGEDCDCNEEVAIVSAELLGKHFGGDSDILTRMMSNSAKELILEKEIFFLCEGWPESKELDRIFELIRKKKPQMSYEAYFQLICQKSSSDFVFRTLMNVLSDPRRIPQWQSQVAARAILRRVQKDESLFTMLMEHLKDDPTPSEKATIAGLIGTARGVSSELKAWLIEEIDQQINGRGSPEIGIDWTIGEPQPVAHSLLNLIG